MYRFFPLLLLFLSFSCAVHSQHTAVEGSNARARRAFDRALVAYEHYDYQTALQATGEAISHAPAYTRAHLLRAEIFYQQRQFDQSAEAYSSVIDLSGQTNPRAFFFRGMSYYFTGAYDGALQDFRQFLLLEPQNRGLGMMADSMVVTAGIALAAVNNPVPFSPVNPGAAINTAEAEYSPSITADGETLVFTRRERSPGSRQEAYEVENFYISHKINGAWTPAVSLGPPINTQGNEGAQSLSVDGRDLYFTACNRPDGYGSCDIYHARLTGDEWTTPVNLGSVNSSSWDSHPSISPDGNTLYFSSARRGNVGKTDLWFTTRDSTGRWQEPKNMGPAINTAGREMSPFIHHDNQTLYFASDGHPGMGGLDLFYSRRDENGSWSAPANLGYPINTHADEFSLVIDATGTTAWYASDTEGGYGNMDLYFFDLHEQARPLPMTYMKGRVFDSESGGSLEATFELVELESGNTIIRSQSDPKNGSFLVVVPLQQPMALNVSAPGYLFFSEHFHYTLSRDKTDPYLEDIGLQKINPGESVVLRNVFFRTGSYELDQMSVAELERLIRLLEENPDLHIRIDGHTDHVGSYADNLVLSGNRAGSVVNYLTDSGISSDRITFMGFADTMPIDTNDTEEGRSRNRRTEFTIVDPSHEK